MLAQRCGCICFSTQLLMHQFYRLRKASRWKWVSSLKMILSKKSASIFCCFIIHSMNPLRSHQFFCKSCARIFYGELPDIFNSNLRRWIGVPVNLSNCFIILWWKTCRRTARLFKITYWSSLFLTVLVSLTYFGPKQKLPEKIFFIFFYC